MPGRPALSPMRKSSRVTRLLTALAGVTCALAALAGQCSPFSGYVPGDVCPLYDGDCDSISTAVEWVDTNRALYHFDPALYDNNPSVAHGVPGDGIQQGTLEGGINLPDLEDGTTPFYHYYQPLDAHNSNDWGTLSLINTIEGTARLWGTYPRAPCMLYGYIDRASRFGAGDLSKYGGGLWESTVNPGLNRHDSHQNGLDVDVRFLRLSGQETPLDLTTSDSTDYDGYSTVDLTRCFVRVARNRVVAIFVDTVYAKVSNEPGSTIVVHDVNHRNHFHVRILDPDGPSGQCRRAHRPSQRKR